MKRLKSIIPYGLVIAACISVSVGLAADLIGMGEAGFGVLQFVLVILGILFLGAGVIVFAGQDGDEVNPANLSRGYRSAAEVITNLLFAFLLVNILLFALFSLTDAVGLTVRTYELPVVRLAKNVKIALDPFSPKRFVDPRLTEVYPGWSMAEIRTLRTESYERPFRYEPFTQFTDRGGNGEYVNLHEAGFRLGSEQVPWPMDDAAYNVMVFGGSTTFGTGLPDWLTIPSQLQQLLDDNGCEREVFVYNFGERAYYSAQERVLYMELLLAGHQPDLVIFIDGTNEYAPVPGETAELARFMSTDGTLGGTIIPDLTDEELIERWLNNKALIEALSTMYDVEAFFVWQPHPSWNYDSSYQLFPNFLDASGYYAVMNTVRETQSERLGDNFLWLADIQADRHEPLYVDPVHYTADFAGEIAAYIVDFVLERSGICQ